MGSHQKVLGREGKEVPEIAQVRKPGVLYTVALGGDEAPAPTVPGGSGLAKLKVRQEAGCGVEGQLPLRDCTAWDQVLEAVSSPSL